MIQRHGPGRGSRRGWFVWLAAVLCCCGPAQPAGAEQGAGAVGSQVADLVLHDPGNGETTLSEVAQGKPVVVVFIGVECPLVRLYLPRMQELQTKFESQGVRWVAVDSNAQDSAAEFAALGREFGWSGPLASDPAGHLADALAAKRTPEVLLLDGGRVVRYRGRIDDQYAVGRQRYAATQFDLSEAIEAVLAGAPVARPETEAVGCFIGRKHLASAGGSTTYHGAVADILRRNCVTCHRAGDIGPFALDNYEEASAWAQTLLEAVEARRMPPWPPGESAGAFQAEYRLSDAERQTLRDWLSAGTPQGQPQPAAEPTNATVDAASADVFQPDAVYPMHTAPFDVQATGTLDYQYFAIDPQWSEERWIRRVRVIPGEPSVVHHVLLFAQKPGVRYLSIYPGELIGAFVPGFRDTGMPAGTAYRLPPGTKILFQMHYTPNGVPRRDLTHVAFEFAKPEEVQREARSGRAINVMFQIPPGDASYQAQASYRFRRETQLLKLIPHMHVRGKAFRYELVYPDGRRETVLEIPRWDFNWQLEYVLREPKLLPAGTELLATAIFDNSAENLTNPDASQWVTFGEQTWDEMLIGFFIASEARGAAAADPASGLVAAAEAALRPGERGDGQRLAKGLLGVLRAAGDLRPGQREPVAEEADHVLLGALAELNHFRHQAEQRGAPTANLRDAAARVRRGLEVLQRLTNEPGVQATEVSPVAWPLKKSG